MGQDVLTMVFGLLRAVQKDKIANSSFMKKRAIGVPPTEISAGEVMEVVELVLNFPIEEVLLIGR